MVIQRQDIVFDKEIQQLEPPTTIKLEKPGVIINPLLTIHLQASSIEMAMTTNFSTTIDINQVKAQPTTNKSIESAEQTLQLVQQLLQQSKQSTKSIFSLRAMLAQKKEVQHVKASGDKPRSYQKAINSSE